MERFERALDAACRRVETEFGEALVGLLFAGSAAYGTPMRNSDIDLYVLIDADWRQRRNRVIEDVEVEMFINPVAQIRRELDDGPNATVEMFARGRILHDRDGAVTGLVERAKQVAAQPPTRPSDTELYFIRYTPSDLVRDTEDLVEIDPRAGEFLAAVALHAVLEAHWHVRGDHPPKPKRILQAIQDDTPEIAQAAQQVMDTSVALNDRVRCLRELCERVLTPAGGMLLEGQTAPEKLGDGI